MVVARRTGGWVDTVAVETTTASRINNRPIDDSATVWRLSITESAILKFDRLFIDRESPNSRPIVNQAIVNSDFPLAKLRQNHGQREEQRRAGDLPKRFFAAQRRHHVADHLEWREQICAKQDGVQNARQRPAGDQSGTEQRAGAQIRVAGRSEERRVGKECRSRWWACH